MKHIAFNDLMYKESRVFPALFDVMEHKKKDTHKEFLCFINNIIDHIQKTTKQNQTDFAYHIIHIPHCTEYARELLVRFILYKAAFTFNKKMTSRIESKIYRTLSIPEGLSGKSKKYLKFKEEQSYFKKIVQSFKEFTYIAPTSAKTLFITKESDTNSSRDGKNPWLHQLYTEDIASQNCDNILTTDMTAFDLEKELKSLFRENKVPRIKNIFLFHSKNKNKLTCSYSSNQIDRLNKYGLGIKNCFVFSFSKEPFRLYKTIELKNKLASDLLQKEVVRFNDFDNFITFTQAESNLLFNRKKHQFKAILNSVDRDYFTSGSDYILDELPHDYHYRNLLSLAYTSLLQQEFVKKITDENPNCDIKPFQDFFDFYLQFWFNNIQPCIEKFLGAESSVAFIVPYELPKSSKSMLRMAFYQKNRTINFHTFYDLKNKKVKAKKVVVLQFRYTDSKYKSYPNSFDALPLLPGQESLTVINKITHNYYYESCNYQYLKRLNGLLYSNFRKEKLDWKLNKYPKPIMSDFWHRIDEAEYDSREYLAEKCKIEYKEGKTREFLAATRVLCKTNNAAYKTFQLKDLYDKENIEIQILDDLVNQISENLISKAKENSSSELLIRTNEKYALTDKEINSSTELWRILLNRKVAERGSSELVYNEIFSESKEINLNSFQRWTDFDIPMILPRSRKVQNLLLQYLGFDLGSPYHRIILTKKLGVINKSRILNSQIENLLSTILAKSELTEFDFKKIKENYADILMLLDINAISDIKALINLLEFNFQTASIYDKE